MQTLYLWLPYGIGQAIIFLPYGVFSSSVFFFSRLISAVADWMSTILAHMVWPANLRCRSETCCTGRGSLQIQNAKSRQKIAIWAPSHKFVGLYHRNHGRSYIWGNRGGPSVVFTTVASVKTTSTSWILHLTVWVTVEVSDVRIK